MIGSSSSRRAHCALGNVNPSRSLVSTPLAFVLSGPNLLAMLQVDVSVVVRHLLLSVTVCLQDLFFGHHLGGVLLLAGSLWRSSHTGFTGSLAVATISLYSFRSFLIVLAILPCSWVCSSAPHIVD